VAIMMAVFGHFFHWRTSADRINAEANRLLHENGGRALFRALECELDAQDDRDQRQTRYWHAVHDELCRRIRREAFIASIVPRRSPQ
jgi:hypothetical protein